MEERSEVVDLLEKMLKPVHDEEIRFLNEVKDTLTDPQERANYDAGQAQSQSSAAFGRDLDDFLNQAFASGATGSFTFNSNGGFAQTKSRASKRPKADRHNVQMQRGQEQPATIAQLQEQVQLLQNELLSTQTAAASEAEKARSDLCAAEQQSTATIAQLQEQVQTLSMDLCTRAAALEEFQGSMTAASARLAQASRVPKASSAKVCSLHVRDYFNLKLKAQS
jgi:curved DNA-binding protein CbpA